MKVTLVFPRFKYISGDPPLGIVYIASHLRSHLDVDISVIDTTFNPSFEYVSKQLEHEKPDIVGIYIDTIMFNDAMKIAEIAKDMGAFVIAGGPHPTVMPETVIGNVDAVCIGEGEETIVEVVKRLQQNKSLRGVKGIWFNKNSHVVKESKRSPIENLDSLEFPARDLLDMKRYIKNWHSLDSLSTNLRGTSLITSRGCPFNCSFCQPTLKEIFGKKVRLISPENVVNEIKKLKEDYGIDGFFLHDDSFTAFKSYVQKFCELLKKEDLDLIWGCNSRVDTISRDLMKIMKSAGLRIIHVGVESGSQRILDLYNKGTKARDISKALKITKEAGINVQSFFMLGAPTETKEEIKQTIKFACSLDTDEASFSLANPMPGTYLFNFLKTQDISLSKDFGEFDYYSSRGFTDKLSFDELKKLQRKAILYFYLHPRRWRYIFKHLASLRGTKKMLMKLGRYW